MTTSRKVAAAEVDDESRQRELVVLIHGLASSPLDMFRLSLLIKAEGYQTYNWGYWSIGKSIEAHADRFSEFLDQQLARADIREVHVVAHSMGCIVTRAALVGSPKKLGRVVMLAPPNHGSHVARLLETNLGRLVRPLRELSDDPGSYVNQLSEPVGYEIGVVAAKKDKVIRLANTHLRCERDHIVLPGNHAILSWRRFAAEQSLAFIKNGAFERE